MLSPKTWLKQFTTNLFRRIRSDLEAIPAALLGQEKHACDERGFRPPR
jgi:hypothetical protein